MNIRQNIKPQLPDIRFVNGRLKTFLINLHRSPDRLLRMSELLTEIGLEFERVEAVDGAKITLPCDDFDEKGYLARHGRKPNLFEIGCFLSHVKCARALLETDAPHALILEDDLVFDPDLLGVLEAALDDHESWDLLRLSTVNHGRKFSVKPLTPRHSLSIAMTREKGSGAYLINRKAARWIIEDLIPMRLPYDLAFDLEQGTGLRSLFVTPEPIRQDADRKTLIQSKLGKYRLGRTRPATVIPYRILMETSRFLYRMTHLIRWLVKNGLSF